MPDVEIEPSLLPDRCVLDAGVLLLALGQRGHRPDASTCRAFWRSLTARERLIAGARVLIPAPALAELLRGTTKDEPPRARGVYVAPFTGRVAQLLGRHLPQTILDHHVERTGLPHAYVKFDAMIAATAIAYEATLVALDGWFHNLQPFPVPVRRPSDFVKKQTVLPLVG